MRSRAHEGSLKLEIGGTVVRITGVVGAARAWSRKRYRPFLSSRPADVTITIDRGRRPSQSVVRPSLEWGDGEFALAMGAYEARGALPVKDVRLTVPPRQPPINPTILRYLSSFVLFQAGGYLLHASAVLNRGRAWVFCGPSNSGKTTIARLAGRRRVLNDDTVAVTKRSREFRVSATPFFGEGGPEMAAKNVGAPIGALFFLTKSDGFAHRPLTSAEAVERAFPEVFLPKRNPRIMEDVLDALIDLTRAVACYELFFAPRAELWEYLRGVA